MRGDAAQASGQEALVLVVEDDRALREGLVTAFRRRGWRILEAGDGPEGLKLAFDRSPDVIVLDLMLPGLTGFDLLAELRERGLETPVLILSARGRVEEKVEGFRLGADDYVTKPFHLPELMARVETMLRRLARRREAAEVLTFGPILVDVPSRTVRRRGTEVPLLAREFDLLCLLARNPGRPFRRETILERVWGWDFEGTTRTVDNYVLSLRQKLEDDPTHPRHIRTVRQVGYRLDP
jgi:DNA-binding response OmpR family regulator